MLKKKKLLVLVIAVIAVALTGIILSVIFGGKPIGTKPVSEFDKMDEVQKEEYISEVVNERFGKKFTVHSILKELDGGYQALVTDDEYNEFSIWIDNMGVVNDTSYAIKYGKKAEEYITHELDSILENYKLIARVYILENPGDSFNENTSAKDFLFANGVTVDCNLILDATQPNLDVSKVKKALNGMSASVSVYIVNDISKADSISAIAGMKPVSSFLIDSYTDAEQ